MDILADMLRSRAVRDWLFSVALCLPVFAFFGAHYGAELVDPDRIGTGFIQYDQPCYMASAREFIDGNHAGFLYALPRERDLVVEPTLVQLHLWWLSWIWRATGLDPGWLFNLFGFVFSVLLTRVLLAVLDQCVPLVGGTRRWAHLLFVWGGGLLCFAGMLQGFVNGLRGGALLHGMFDLDPAGGWWFLNLGRTMLYPNEAYYHFMVFLALLLLMRERFLPAVIITLVLVWSHPFAGIGLLSITSVWAVLERWYVRNKNIPPWYLAALGCTWVTNAWYMFVWLPRHANATMVDSMRFAWTLSADAFVPAYILVGLMALFHLRSPARTWMVLSTAPGRLFFVMAVVNFMLENHEFAFTPHQPIHFARGYVWAALFLVGAPWLFQEAWPWLRKRYTRAGVLVAVALSFVVLSDNLFFFASQIRGQLRATAASYWVTRDGQATLTALEGAVRGNELLVSQDFELAHLAQVYTPCRTYAAHFYDPAERDPILAQQRAFFEHKEVTDTLLLGPLLVVNVKDSGLFIPRRPAQTVYENDSYRVLRVEPLKRPSPAR